ncbi:MAG: prolipoprotein diacylglyceryl transferase [Bacteroidales bacterium]|nr:prolipoprotein diacylglyceryl transferase [Bacteroidales bacterium]
MNFFYVVWDVDPVFLHLGPLQIRYYGLLFALGFVFGYFLLKYMFKKENAPLQEIDKMSLYVILGAVIGARLGHVFFYEPEYYLSNPHKILAIWEGGLASHGGGIGLAIGLYLYGRRSWNKSELYIMDRIAVLTPLAGSLIRLGNLFNSEIYGHETSLPWGFIFVRDGVSTPHHPTQIYEALGYLIIFFILWIIYQRKNGIIPRGYLMGWTLVLIFVLRFMVEFVKNVQVEWEVQLVQTIGLNMGQLLSIPFVLIGAFYILHSKKLGLPPMPKNSLKK